MPRRKWADSMRYLSTQDKWFFGIVIVVCELVPAIIIMYELLKQYAV